MRQTFPDALRIDLLAPDIHREYTARPERLRQLVDGNPERRVVVLDEVQRAPGLLDVVHELIERGGRDRGPRFVLSGSSSRKLKREGVNLLAGRAVVRFLHPFLAAELGERFDLDAALTQGLVPLVWDSPNPPDALKAYASLYLREEVQLEGLVRNIGDFARFLEAISFSHAAVLNLSEVARECQVSRKTAEGYVSILEDLLLSFRLPPFTRRAQRLLATHPKFYWFDAGVFVTFRPSGPLDRLEEIAGAALEGLVAQQLRAWIDSAGAGLSMSFWRTKSGAEVDFVLYGSDGFHALEVKHASSVRSQDLRSLKAFRDDYPEADLRLLYRGDEAFEIDGIRCLPCADFLLGLVPGMPLP